MSAKSNKFNKTDECIPASLATLPEGVAITAIKNMKYDPYDSTLISTRDLYKEIREQEKNIETGDLQQIERFLYSQAIALNAVFDRMLNQLAHAEFTTQVQISAMIALKAQAMSSYLGNTCSIKKSRSYYVY